MSETKKSRSEVGMSKFIDPGDCRPLLSSTRIKRENIHSILTPPYKIIDVYPDFCRGPLTKEK